MSNHRFDDQDDSDLDERDSCCSECGGDGFVFGGDGLFFDDPERFGENETYTCPNCGGSGKAEDMEYR